MRFREFLVVVIIGIIFPALSSLPGRADEKKITNHPIKGLFSSVNSNYETKQTIVIDDEKKWEVLCKERNITDPPKIDFANEQVIIVAGGKFQTSGYEVKIHSVVSDGEKARVKYSINPPIVGENTSPVTTTPLAGVVIEKTKLPVEFVDIVPEIEDLIKKLGDDDWEVRESATESLVQTGKASVPHLLNSIKDKDPEVAMRCRLILSQVVPAVLVEQSGWLGVTMMEIATSDPRVSEHIKEGIGIDIQSAIQGQPAEKFGLKVSDIIISINNQGFGNLEEWITKIRTTVPGTRVTLGIVRDGAKQDLEVVVGNRPVEYREGVPEKLWEDWFQKYIEQAKK